MTEQEFLENRHPFYLSGEELDICFPTGNDRKNTHDYLAKKYGYSWIFSIRGYWWPNSHVALYQGDYETPNMTVYVCQYLFNHFKDINYIGLGCNKGKPGEVWTNKIYILRSGELMKNDIRSI